MTSEIRANKQTNRAGLGTVTYADTGIIVSGIVTANSLGGIGHINLGSNIQLGNAGIITASSYRGDGSQLTGIDAGIPGISTTGISTFRDVQVGGAITCTGTIVNKIDATTENSVIIGLEAADLNTNNDNCVFIGYKAGYKNGTGTNSNIFIGTNAGGGYGGTIGSQNVMIGGGCGTFMYGGANYNTALGQGAGYYNNKSYCVSIGGHAGASRGQYNTAIGGRANGEGHQMDTNYMTYPNNNDATQWGDNNICIGYQSNTPHSEADNYIVIGNSKNTNFVVGTLGVEVTAGVTTHSGSVVVGAGVSVVGIVTAANFVKADGSAVGGVVSDAQNNTVGGTNAGDSFSGTSATNNTLFGYNAGTAINSGDYNTVFGGNSGKLVTSGTNNTILGYAVAINLTTGGNNCAVGRATLNNITSQSSNTAIGDEAMISNQGSNQTAVGRMALASGGSGSDNVAVGYLAGGANTSGASNTFVGFRAGQTMQTGSNCIMIGHEAAPSSTGANNEITLGDGNITKFRIPGINFVLKDNGGTPTQGHVLKVDGNGEASFAAGGVTSDAQFNTVAGTNAGDSFSGTSAIHNTLFGYNAGTSLTTGDKNVIIGSFPTAPLLDTESQNVIIGYDAGIKDNIENNVFVGYRSGKNVTGDGNVSVGENSLSETTSGVGNVAVGSAAGYSLASGEYNIAIGSQAIEYGQNKDYNIGIGLRAVRATTGEHNIGIGNESMRNGSDTPSGQRNIYIGNNNTTCNLTSGNQNLCLGWNVGHSITSGSNNIVLGSEAEPSSATVSNEITLGDGNVTRFRIPGLGLDFNGNNFDLGDNKYIRLGSSQDLEIFHDGSHSYVKDVGTGDLVLQTQGGHVHIKYGGHTMALFQPSGYSQLYFNNSLKFATTGTGVKITGNARTDIVSVSDGSNITIPMNTGTHFTVTLGGNRTFINSNMQTSDAHGSSGSIFIVQDGTGGRTAAFQSNYKFAGGTAPTLSTAANAVDRLDYVVRDTNVVHCVLTLDVK